MDNKEIYVARKKESRGDNILLHLQAKFDEAGEIHSVSPDRATQEIKNFYSTASYSKNIVELVEKGFPFELQIVTNGPRTDFIISSPIFILNKQWNSQNKNSLFVNNDGIGKIIEKYGSVVPVDKINARIYSPISLDKDGNLFAENGFITEYSIDDFSFIDNRVKADKDIYVIPNQVYSMLEKQKIKDIDFINLEGLRKWLENTVRNYYSADEMDKILESIGKNGDDEVFNIRKERCKRFFSLFAKSDLDYFVNRKEVKNVIDKERQKLREEMKVSLKKEEEKGLAQVETLVTQRKEALETKLKSNENDLENKRLELLAVEKKIIEYNEKVEEKKLMLTLLEEQTASLERQKEDISKAKDSVLKDFSVAFEKLYSPYLKDDVVKRPEDESFFKTSSNAEEVDKDNLSSIFSTNKFDKVFKDELFSVLTHKASIIPNVSYAYAVAHFTGNTFLKIITVEHGWYHYEDFVQRGLLDFYNEALMDSDDNNYLLVLQNINIVPIECSLKPLIDVINGNRLTLPNAKENFFPQNLRILATILSSNDEDSFGIKLDDSSYKNFNYVFSPEDELPVPLDNLMQEKQKRYLFYSTVKMQAPERGGASKYVLYRKY